MRRAWIPALVVLALLAVLPDTALACPVCFDPRDENRMAFMATAAFLTVLPLGMMGGMGAWLWKKVREGDEVEGGEAGEGESESRD